MAPVYHILTGPTAAGKTGYLLSIAGLQPTLVISADSRQVYSHMDIGTGKPTPTELEMLPHCGIDCLKPGINYSVHQFLTHAAMGLARARKEKCRVWVCGGTGLYIRAMTEQLDLGEAPRPLLRKALAHRLGEISSRTVARALDLAVRDPDNPVRVIRRAELDCADSQRASDIYAWAGLEPDLAGVEGAGDPAAFEPIRAELARWQAGPVYVLDPGREELHRRIEVRVAGMFADGLVDEVAALRNLGYGDTGVVRDGIGYREAGGVLDGALSQTAALERTVIRTRQYAKRQRTYFMGRGWHVCSDSELATVLRSFPE